MYRYVDGIFTWLAMKKWKSRRKTMIGKNFSSWLIHIFFYKKLFCLKKWQICVVCPHLWRIVANVIASAVSFSRIQEKEKKENNNKAFPGRMTPQKMDISPTKKVARKKISRKPTSEEGRHKLGRTIYFPLFFSFFFSGQDVGKRYGWEIWHSPFWCSHSNLSKPVFGSFEPQGQKMDPWLELLPDYSFFLRYSGNGGDWGAKSDKIMISRFFFFSFVWHWGNVTGSAPLQRYFPPNDMPLFPQQKTRKPTFSFLTCSR